MVIPIVLPGSGEILSDRRLNPSLMFEGERCVLLTHAMGAIPMRHMGRPCGTLTDDHYYVVRDAIDYLLTGV